MRRIDLEDAALFGAGDARNPIEAEGLKRYFISLPGYAAVLRGQKTIVVGRKGTGKSAIKSQLLAPSKAAIHIDIEPLLPTHPLFAAIGRALENTDNPSYATYEHVWRAYALASIIKSLVQNAALGFGDSSSTRWYVEKLTGHRPPRLVERVQEIGSRFERLAVATREVDGKALSAALPSDTEIVPLFNMIAQACASNRTRIVAVIDRVDQQLERPQLGGLWDNYSKYVGGLCLATARIASLVESRCLSLYSFVRDDLLAEVEPQLHNATEFRDLIYHLPWRADQLMDLLGTRIAAALEEEYDVYWSYDTKSAKFFSPQLFSAVFEPHRLDDYMPWQYFLLHTHMRPRDLIELCNACREEAVASQKGIIDGNAINRGMWRYSHLRYTDLVATYRYMVTNFQQLIDSFRYKPLRLTRAVLVQHLSTLTAGTDFQDATQGGRRLNAEELLRILYKTGFLVAPVDDRRAAGLPYVAYYIDPNRLTEEQENWIIHPAYFRELHKGAAPKNVRSVLEDNA